MLFISMTMLCVGMYAQTIGTGSIQGTVEDQSGAVVRNASVTAVDPATGYTVTQHTGVVGLYVLSSLPAAKYRVTVNAAGFQTLIQENVSVDAMTIVGLNLKLEVGKSSQTVVVSTLPPQLDTSNGSLEVTLPNSTYSALPLAMSGSPKDPLGFVTLMPGAEGGAYGPAELNGGPGQTSFRYINGMPIVTAALQGDNRNVTTETSTEVVDQFQVITSGVPAYYQGQGITNFIMKTGTNRFHGDIYDNIRNTIFDAAGYFATKTPVEQQNEYGATLGGPIIKNRLFFFFNFDGFRYNAGSNPAFISIPTMAERKGDFSALPVPIYDPATTKCTKSGLCTRQPFPNNIIPPNRISSISKSLEAELPAPINSSIQNNYLGILTGGLQQNMFLGKGDLTITNNNHLYYLTQYGKKQPVGLPNAGPPIPLPYTSSRYFSTVVEVDQIGDTEVITPNLVNVFGYQINRFLSQYSNATTKGDYASKAGLTGLPTNGQALQNFPHIAFGGPNAPVSWAGNSTSFSQFDTTNTFQNNLQWIRGKHSVTVGGQIMLEANDTSTPSTVYNISFAGTTTAGFSPQGRLLTTTGNGYASYLLGDVDSSTILDQTVNVNRGRYGSYAVYAQDDWRIKDKLMLNLGLRYEIHTPAVEAKNRTSWLNGNLPNPAVDNYPGALQFAGNGPDSCHCRTLVKTHYLTFDPRVGFAYSATNKKVIRGSFTIIHYDSGALGGNMINGAMLGYFAQPSFNSPDAGITPAFNWNNGFPAYTKPPFFSPTLNTGYNTTTGPNGGTINYPRPNTAGRSPYTENWNLTFEQQLTTATVMSLSYSGSAAHLLVFRGGNGFHSDQINPQYLKLGNLLRARATPAILAQAQAIMPGIKLPYPSFVGSIGQMLRPYPQYSGVSDFDADFGNAIYHSLQTYVQHTMSNGLYFLASFTWARRIDNAGGSNAALVASSTARTAYNHAIERSVDEDPRSLSLAWVYALPFGRGHAWGGNNSLLNTIVGGWQLSGINKYSLGQVIGTIGGVCNVPYTGGCYADFNPSFSGPVRINGSYGSGNPKGANGMAPTKYLNINAFQNAAPFTFGNTPRTGAFGLKNPASLNEDISLGKNFNVVRGTALRLQADAFNVFNRVEFGAVNQNITSASFGTVAGQANGPRILQFEAYFKF